MKHFRTFWLLLTLMMVGSFTLTSCVDNQEAATRTRSMWNACTPLLTRNKNL